MVAGKPDLKLTLILLVGVVLLLFRSDSIITFVDIVSVLERADRISRGHDLLHPLYPVGYPAFLSLFSGHSGLYAAKILSLLSAVFLLWCAGREVGIRSAVALLCCTAWVTWGSTEGTDMLAAALSVSAILCAPKHTLFSVFLLGVACLVRYTAWIAIPIVLLLVKERMKGMLLLFLLTLPHWGMVLWAGALPFDQSENIARGADASLWQRGSKALFLLVSPLCVLGAVGQYVGRRDPRIMGLCIFALLHALAIVAVFPNERLLLPSVLGLVVGVGRLSARWLPIVVGCGLWGLGQVPSNEDWRKLDQLADSTKLQQGRFLASSAQVYSWRETGIQASIPLSEVADPLQTDPKILVQWMKGNDVPIVVIRERDCDRFPALIHLFREPQPPEITQLECLEDWCIYSLSNFNLRPKN